MSNSAFDYNAILEKNLTRLVDENVALKTPDKAFRNALVMGKARYLCILDYQTAISCMVFKFEKRPQILFYESAMGTSTIIPVYTYNEHRRFTQEIITDQVEAIREEYNPENGTLVAFIWFVIYMGHRFFDMVEEFNPQDVIFLDMEDWRKLLMLDAERGSVATLFDAQMNALRQVYGGGNEEDSDE